MPFEGGALELLHAIVQKRPMPVHEVRRDVPQVLANIIDKVKIVTSHIPFSHLTCFPCKLLAKSPDGRYQSAHGLKIDLLECQRRLLAVVSALSGEPQEVCYLLIYERDDAEPAPIQLIPPFEIALGDRYMVRLRPQISLQV